LVVNTASCGHTGLEQVKLAILLFCLFNNIYLHLKQDAMKKIIPVAIFAVLVCACNNAGKDSNTNDSDKTPGVSSDTLPRTPGGDTSSYERMQNRVTDSAH
jgi:hypothetical protein